MSSSQEKDKNLIKKTIWNKISFQNQTLLLFGDSVIYTFGQKDRPMDRGAAIHGCLLMTAIHGCLLMTPWVILQPLIYSHN